MPSVQHGISRMGRSAAHPACLRSRSVPFQRHRDVSRHATGKTNDLDPELVSALTEVLCPELIDLLRHAGQRFFPARFLLIDGPALVRAQLIRKSTDLHFGLAVAHGPLDDRDRAPNSL